MGRGPDTRKAETPMILLYAQVGEISEEDYVAEEAVVFQALRDIRARKEALARQYAADRGEEEGGIGIYTGYGDRNER